MESTDLDVPPEMDKGAVSDDDAREEAEEALAAGNNAGKGAA